MCKFWRARRYRSGLLQSIRYYLWRRKKRVRCVFVANPQLCRTRRTPLGFVCFLFSCLPYVRPPPPAPPPPQYEVIFFSDGLEAPTVSHPRLVVKAGDDSHVKFVQNYLSQGGVCLANGLTRITVGVRADVVSGKSLLLKKGAG